MEHDEEFEIDPAIAAAMGFSGFGASNKKRKYNRDDGFVDPDISRPAPDLGTGANSMPTGMRRPTSTSAEAQSDELSKQRDDAENVAAPSATGNPQSAGEPSLQALCFGVQNQDGDTVYFKPSFLEDPWAGLIPTTT